MTDDVTVVIPTIPSRSRMLQRAIGSVSRQRKPAAAIVVVQDNDGVGAWETRNRGLIHVHTKWTAFLDDDDELLPHHLEQLIGLATDAAVGVAWGWFDVVGGLDPFPMHRGRTFDPDNPHIVPITYVARTEALFAAVAATGGFAADPDQTGAWDIQDAPVFVAMARDAGTVNTTDATWLWHHHASNTSGLPSRA